MHVLKLVLKHVLAFIFIVQFTIFLVDFNLTNLRIYLATEDKCHYKGEVRLESEEDKR